MGWARANLLYDSLGGSMPESGSLKEAVCLLVYQHRAERDFYKTLLLAQPPQDSGRRETFAKYKSASFPHFAELEKKIRAAEKRLLDNAFNAGPMRIVVAHNDG